MACILFIRQHIFFHDNSTLKAYRAWNCFGLRSKTSQNIDVKRIWSCKILCFSAVVQYRIDEIFYSLNMETYLFKITSHWQHIKSTGLGIKQAKKRSFWRKLIACMNQKVNELRLISEPSGGSLDSVLGRRKRKWKLFLRRSLFWRGVKRLVLQWAVASGNM